jgi:tetratricopeptide (TPR) repeat protein
MYEYILKEVSNQKQKNGFQNALNLLENNIKEIENKYSKESLEYFNMAKELCEICNLIAEKFYDNGKFNEGLNYLEKSIKLFANFKEIQYLCNNNLGNYYRKLGELNKAYDSFTRSIELGLLFHNKKIIGEGYINCGIILLLMEMFDKSIELCLSGIILLQECLLNKKDLSNDIYNILNNAYTSIALCYYKNKNFLESLLYYDISEKLNKKLEIEYTNTILNDETKYKMLTEILNQLEKEKLLDKTEKMSNNYMIEKIKNLISQIEEKNSWNSLMNFP